MDRRHFLQTSLALTGTGLVAGNLAAQQTENPQAVPQAADPQAAAAHQRRFIANGDVAPERHLTCYPDTNARQLNQLWLSYDNHTVLSYRAHHTQKHPYFEPMMGPVSGLPLTTEAARPYPHHRGIFFGVDRVDGGGATGSSFWEGSLGSGQILSQGPTFAQENGLFKVSETSAEMVDFCLWRRGTRDPIIEDRRRFVFTILDNRRYILDVEFELRVLTELSFRRTNHGLFGIRCSPDLAPAPYGTGTLISSEGRQGSWCDKSPGGRRNNLENGVSLVGVHGHPARWLAFYGQRARANHIVEGIALFCPSKAPHPAFESCPWFSRDYGNISPMPMHWFDPEKPMVLSRDEVLKLRYRVVAFAGTPAEAGLDTLWEEFDRAG